MELETINRLFLELSQVATATPRKELELKQGLKDAAGMALSLCYLIEDAGTSEALNAISLAAADLREHLVNLGIRR